MGSIAIDNRKNQGSAGTKDSTYFAAGSDSSSSTHEVTLNYGQGHWCSCRGMIAKKRKFGSVADPHQNTGLPQTSRHYCKHVQAIRTADPSIRIEARRIRNDAFGIMETPTDAETGATGERVEAPAPVATTGRRAAVKASREAKAARGDGNARERIEQIEIELAAARKQLELEDSLAALTEKHGAEAVQTVLSAALTEAA
jgi:hypothetical protein